MLIQKTGICMITLIQNDIILLENYMGTGHPEMMVGQMMTHCYHSDLSILAIILKTVALLIKK